MRVTLLRSTSLLLVVSLVVPAQDRADLATVHRIRAEAFQNGKVMDHLAQLTDVNGPRLTGSPGYKSAAEWAVKELKAMGLENARLEKWGPFGKGWSYSRFSLHMVAPTETNLIGFPMAWTSGTNGPLRAEAMHAVLRTAADLDKAKGTLKGKIVLMDAPREVTMATDPLARRWSPEDLTRLEGAPEPGQSPFAGPGRPPTPPANMAEMRRFRERLRDFLRTEGAAAVLTVGTKGDGGTLFATSFGSQDAKAAPALPAAVIAVEHYNRIVRLLGRKVPVTLELDVQARFHDETLDSWNVVAELPGNGKKGEVVMLGAHLDSWHGGTGTTDNAAGVSVMMEAMRVLKAIGAKPERTIRIALWSGEEQGLLGSRAYVKEHFADPEVMQPKPEHGRLSAYYNLDNGTGKIRGVYLQGNDMLRPIFETWLAPFRDLGATTLSIRSTGSTDHVAFDSVGLPGFQFIQDPIAYSTRTHHSNMDGFDHAQRGDLMQAAAIVASFAYHTATREELLPRKALPKPQPRRQDTVPPAEQRQSDQPVLPSAGQ